MIMKTTIKISVIMFAIITAIFNHSCMKEGFKKPAKPTEIVKDNAIAEKAFSDLNNQVQAGVFQAQSDTENGKGLNLMNSNCATITISPYDWNTFPKTIEIDYGAGCLGDDGVMREGKINIETTGWYRQHGTVITVVPDSFYVDDILVEGIQITTNNGLNANQNITYTVVTDGTVTTPYGVIQWNSNLTSEWIAGEPTLFNPWDDEYLVSGTQQGSTAPGDSYSIVILVPLHLKTNCGYIVAGELKYTIDGYQDEIFVDYGNGNCDNIATITYMGQTYTIVMQ